MLIGRTLTRTARRHPTNTAIVGSDGYRLTYEALEDHVDRVAAALE